MFHSVVLHLQSRYGSSLHTVLLMYASGLGSSPPFFSMFLLGFLFMVFFFGGGVAQIHMHMILPHISGRHSCYELLGLRSDDFLDILTQVSHRHLQHPKRNC